MKRFLKSFFKKQSPMSSLTAAGELYPSLDLLALFSEQVDRRQIMRTLSQHLERSESDVVKEIAAKLTLPFEPSPESVKLFRTSKNPSLATFAQLGAIPIVRGSDIVGVTCLEPLWLQGIIPEELHRHVRLASWGSIQHALTHSQEVYLSEDLSVEDAVIEVIATRVSEYGGKGFSLTTSSGETFYKFVTPEGTPAQGKIHASIRTKLLARVSSLASYFKGIVIINGTKYQVFFADNGEVCFERKFHVQLSEDSQRKHTKLVPIRYLAEQGISPSEKLPQVLGAHKNGATGANGASHQPQAASYVVIIEDNPIFAKTLSRFLGDQGIEVKHFPLATAALHFLEVCKVPPALIICDLYMPEMSGKGFLDILRNRFSMQTLPVIILTSDDRIETELDLLRSGAIALLSKQEDPRKLCAHIDRVLQSERLPTGLPQAANSR